MPDPPKSKSFLSKKIGPVPMPIALLGTALILFLLYRHYHTARGATSGTSSSTQAPDPNAVDPNTGLTYGAEEQAGLGQIAGPPSTNGTGVGGAGGGLSVGDLEGLLSSLQGLGGQNYYYYGSNAAGAPTPTNPTGAGNASISTFQPVAAAAQTPLAPVSNTPSAPNLPAPSVSLSTTATPSAAAMPAPAPAPNPNLYQGSYGAGAVQPATPYGYGDLYPIAPGTAPFPLTPPNLVQASGAGNFVSTPAVPSTLASGAAAVASHTATVNYQAKARAV